MATDDSTSETPAKKCSKCGGEFPATLEYFTRRKSRRAGFSSQCKACQYPQKNARRISPKTLERERLESEGKKRCKTCQQILLLGCFGSSKDSRNGINPHCKTCMAQKNSEYRANNPEFREREIQKQREYMQQPEIRERVRQQSKERRTDPEHKAHERELERARLKTDYGKSVKTAAYQRRRARLNGAEGTHTASDVRLQYRSQKGKCWHCGKELNGKYHVDHLIPLTKGGTNWPNNIVCSCQPCNQSKHNKLTQEWNGRLF